MYVRTYVGPHTPIMYSHTYVLQMALLLTTAAPTSHPPPYLVPGILIPLHLIQSGDCNVGGPLLSSSLI